MKGIIVLVLLIVLIGGCVVSSGGPSGPRPIKITEFCRFSPYYFYEEGGFSCLNYGIDNEDNLQLEIEQVTGLTLNITRLVCTRKTPEIVNGQLIIDKIKNPIIISSGNHAYVSGGNSGNNVKCTDEYGNIISNLTSEKYQSFNLYMKYSEIVYYGEGGASEEGSINIIPNKIYTSNYTYDKCQKSEIEVKVIEYDYPLSGGYVETPLADAKVDIYNDTEFIKSSYTNGDGISNFGFNCLHYANFKVTKLGYEETSIRGDTFGETFYTTYTYNITKSRQWKV